MSHDMDGMAKRLDEIEGLLKGLNIKKLRERSEKKEDNKKDPKVAKSEEKEEKNDEISDEEFDELEKMYGQNGNKRLA